MNSAVASRESVKNLPSISDSCALFCSRCDGWRLFTPWITRLLMHCHNSARSPSFLLSFAEVHSVFSSLKKMSGERKSFHVCTSRTQIANWRKRKTELLSSLPSLSLSLSLSSCSLALSAVCVQAQCFWRYLNRAALFALNGGVFFRGGLGFGSSLPFLRFFSSREFPGPWVRPFVSVGER